MEPVPILWPHEGYPVAQVDALARDVGELVDGVWYEVVDGVGRGLTAPTVEHQEAVFGLHRVLWGGVPAGLHLVHHVGVALDEDQRAVPDLVVARAPDRARSTLPAADVVLAAEVVAPSTRSDDRFRKPALYAAAGIPWYLRVELDPPHVVAYRLGADGVFEEAGRAEPGGVLRLTEPFPVTLDPAALVR